MVLKVHNYVKNIYIIQKLVPQKHGKTQKNMKNGNGPTRV